MNHAFYPELLSSKEIKVIGERFENNDVSKEDLEVIFNHINKTVSSLH